MRIIIYRIVSFLLIPALLCDPAWANYAVAGKRADLNSAADITAFHDQALASQPAAAWHSSLHAKLMRMAQRADQKMLRTVSPYRDLSPANSLLFLVFKSLGAKGWRAVNAGSISVFLEAAAGSYGFSHILKFLPNSWTHWGPGWIVGPVYVLSSAFFYSVLYHLIEHRDPRSRTRNLWIRFRVFALYAVLSLPILHHFYDIPVILLAIGISGYHIIGAIRAFRRELTPIPLEDISSRGVALGKAIRQAEKERKNLQIALLDMDDLAAYGRRLGVHGRDIINYILKNLLWGPNGVIVGQFGDIVSGNVGGDETYLCFPVSSTEDEESLEKRRKSLEKLRNTLKSRSEKLFSELDKWANANEPLPDLFKQDKVPPTWIEALQKSFRENGPLPPLTFSGGLISYEDLRQSKPEIIANASNRELFSFVRAALMNPINEAKKYKYDALAEHIQMASPGKIPDIFRLETLFKSSKVAQMPRAESQFIINRDPFAPFYGLANIPVNYQFRNFDDWKRHIANVGGTKSARAVIGSIRHWYGGPTLKRTLEQMSQEEGVRTTELWRGGIKTVNTWDPTLSAVDLIVTYEHLEILKALNENLGIRGFKPGQFSITVHASAPDTLFFAWIPSPDTPEAQIKIVEGKIKMALDRYETSLHGALKMSAHLGEQEIEIYPQVVILETENPVRDLENLSLVQIQGLLGASPDNSEIINLFSPENAVIGKHEAPADHPWLTDKIRYVKSVILNGISSQIINESFKMDAKQQIEAQNVLMKRIDAERKAATERARPHPVDRSQEAA